MGYIQTSAPGLEPVTLAEARTWLQLDADVLTSDDELLELVLLPAARKAAETRCNRVLGQSTWRLTMDCFPCGRGCIELDRNPVQSVQSITYLDTAGVQQTLPTTVWKLDASSETTRACVELRADQLWPATAYEAAAVQVNFTAGYATADDVPAGIKHWVLMRLRDMWLYRGETEEVMRGRLERPTFVDGLLDPHHIPTA